MIYTASKPKEIEMLFGDSDNYCVNCEHVFMIGTPGGPYCKRFCIFKNDLISGKQELVEWKTCETARSDEELCGLSGKLYDPALVEDPRPYKLRNK